MHHNNAAPLKEKFCTPGCVVMLVFVAIGLAFAAVRFIFGIGAVSNLNNQYPWGLWIGIDVASGVALAAGGFTTGAIAYVLNRQHYHAVIRPALLTAMLGYTFVVLGLLVDIGRYWNITSPLFNHNGNSVLFEVAMCVMIYLHVLYIEFLPIVVERFKGRVNLPGFLSFFNGLLESMMALADRILTKVMWVFIIAGIVLSCLHQSSLGSLMLIAPSKIHPLWYTPILPLLFLLSAISVGYPMVTVESIIVSKSFGRSPEMDVLTPLAKFMPLLMGIYLVVKVGDMLVRGTYTYLLDGTYQTNAFIIELLFGVILPFIMLLFPRVRRSPSLLFFNAMLFVLGVVLNRINVFIVSYTPPYIIQSYFPAVGEIFITVGLVAALMFLYRVIVFIFPVLGLHPAKMSQAVVALCVFSAVVMTHQAAAADKGGPPLPAIQKKVPSIDDAPRLLLINEPEVNKNTDLYEFSIFMHGKHANVLKDCAICHHRVVNPEKGPDGMPVTMAKLEAMKRIPDHCNECHGAPFQEGNLKKPGLKGALHRRCINCHEEASDISFSRGPVAYSPMVIGAVARNLNTQAPTDCRSCHSKKVPDHSQLVQFEGEIDALTVTEKCLSCHQKQGEAVLKTVHWNWQGPSPYTVGHEEDIDMGKHHRAFNNFCLNLNGNWPDCTGCHIGYGWKDTHFDFNDSSKIDCLVCHDRTEWNEYVKTDAGWPVEDVDLKLVAENVGLPNRSNCGSACHFFGGHGDATKHGALSSALEEAEEPSRELDVHMGGELNVNCQYCHKTKNHMITGRTISSSATEGDISCEYCHTDQPHRKTKMTSYHLDKHVQHVACQTCHIPLFSKAKGSETCWDWSTAGEHSENHHGTKLKKQAGQPTYLWYNGTVERYVMGDPINEAGITNLTTVKGDINDPDAKIYPFKIHRGKQISDKNFKHLLPAQLWSGYTQHWDWDKAIRYAVKSADLEYSGEYEFVETLMYFPLTHEVVPKENALSCASCHTAFTRSDCSRCHQYREGIDFASLVNKGIDFKQLSSDGMPVNELIGKTDYINFKALGYKGDPVETGERRFQKLPMRTQRP